MGKKICSRSRNFHSSRDRLSYLPEHIIHYILSLLTIKEAIRTSVLAKGWRNKWTALTSIDINEESFKLNYGQNRTNRQRVKAFVRFVDWLMSRGIQLHRLSLSLSTYCDPSYVDRWIQQVQLQNISELEVCLCFDPLTEYTLPDRLYSCDAFKSLKLESCHVNKVPSFGSLEVLSLVSLSLENITHLLFTELRYSRLKRLNIEKCTGPTLIIVKAPNLEFLNIDGCYSPSRLRILTPALRTLRIANWTGRAILIKTPSLRVFNWLSSKVEYSAIAPEMKDISDVVIHPSTYLLNNRKVSTAVEFLSVFVDACSLDLGGEFIEAFSYCMPTFHNLKYLKLSAVLDDTGIYKLTFILSKCPNLETLMINCLPMIGALPYTSNDPDCSWDSGNAYQLRNVQIRSFAGYTKEIVLVKHLLSRGHLLEKLMLYTSGTGITKGRKTRIIRWLQKSPTISQNVVISII